MVHQELSLCPHLTVTDSIVLGDEPARFGVLRTGEVRDRVRRALERVEHDGARIDPDARVDALSPADRQRVEIARALRSDETRVVVLDEPTSSLARADVERLFALLRALRDRGLAIVYVSHFLEEVMEIADRYTVLRDGVAVARGRVADTSPAELVTAISGRPIASSYRRAESAPGGVALVARGPWGDLELRRGEVLGVAGLLGSGRTELLRAIFGLDVVRDSHVTVGAWGGPASPWRRLAQGVGMLSEDRKGEGLMLGRSVADNVVLSRMGALVRPAEQRAAAARWIERLRVRCLGPDQPVAELSGGNQQKVALARLLHRDVDVLLLDEPTRGIDVGSKAQICELCADLSSRGKAVLLVSSYFPELLGMCHRIAVMRRAKLGPARPTEAWTEHALLLEAAAG
jgi:ribose transport system ATP-binding protein